MPLTLVQDGGRFGARRWGVGQSGAMDPVALQVGNSMLGNDPNAAAIEVNFYPLRIRLLADLSIALTGADCRARIDGKPIPPWWHVAAKAGQVLELQHPLRRDRSRSYLCVSGGFDVPQVLGSRSTQLRGAFGGLEGRSIRKGDLLPCQPCTGYPGNFGVIPPLAALGCNAGVDEQPLLIRAMPASELSTLKPSSRRRFWDTPWSVDPKSSRMGYRFAGEALEFRAYTEMNSYGIIPGIIQLPPSGLPIVQMADANVSGGYPKLATVIQADMWRLGQAGPGTKIRWVRVNSDEAVRAQRDVASYVNSIRAGCRRKYDFMGIAYEN